MLLTRLLSRLVVPASIVVACAACEAPPPPNSVVVVTPTTLEWTATAGADPQDQLVTIENTGDFFVNAEVGIVGFDDRFSSVGGHVGLRPGEKRELAVTFDPTTASPGLSALHIAGGGAVVDVRLRAEVAPRADCVVTPTLPVYGDNTGTIPLEVRAIDAATGLPLPPLVEPLRWSLAEKGDLAGARLYAEAPVADQQVSSTNDVMLGGTTAHLNITARGAAQTVRVRDDDGRGCETTFIADEGSNIPALSVQLTWTGEADLDLHVVHSAEDCSSRDCDTADWNGDVYSGQDDIFMNPRRALTGQGAELIQFSAIGHGGVARVVVEGHDAAAPTTYRVRVFHKRLVVDERSGIVFPGEVHDVTGFTF